MENTYLRRELEVGVSVPISVLRYSTLSSFHVSVEDDVGRSMRGELEKALLRFSRSDAARHPILVTPTTTSVVVRIGTGCFWRAEVRHPQLDRDFILVDLVDAGVCRKVDNSSIFQPTEELREIPVLSHRCALEGVMEKRDDVSCAFLFTGQRLEMCLIEMEESGVLHVACTSFGEDVGLKAVLQHRIAHFEYPRMILGENSGVPVYNLLSVAGVKMPAVARRPLDGGDLIIQLRDMSHLQELISRVTLAPIAGEITPGQLCLGEYMDQFWRIEVKEVVKATALFPSTYLVEFVDLCEKSFIPRNLLFEMPEELSAYPASSQVVAVYGLQSCSKETEEAVYPLLQEKYVYATVIDDFGGKVMVELDLPSGRDDYRGIPLRQIIED